MTMRPAPPSSTPPDPRHGNWPTAQQAHAPSQPAHPDQRALVLAGAGAAGNAWELGLIAGLCDAGVDLTGADLVVGTSAGSTAAAQITGSTHPTELYAAVLAEVPRPPSPGGAAHRRGTPN